MKMRTQPKAFLVLSALLLVIAFSYPAQIMVIYDHSPLEARSIFEKLAPLNWLVMLGCILVSALAYHASSWTLAMFPLLAILVAWNNWIVAQVGTDFSAVQTSIATLGFASIGGLLFNAEAWEIAVHQDRRWWLRPDRKKIDASVYVIPPQGASFRAHTFDLSTGGAFICESDEIPPSIKDGDQIVLRLTMGALTVLRCDARVIRRVEPRGEYPAGFGVEFLGLKRGDSRELKRYLGGLDH